MADAAGRARPQWEKWTKAQEELSLRKTAQELHYEAYEAYTSMDNVRAARLFHEAAEASAQEGDERAQALNLEWEADSLQCEDRYMEALVVLGEAAKLNIEDNEVQFRTLMRQFDIANMLPIALKKQQAIIRDLSPFKDIRRIGDSRSMVLHSESVLLSDQGKDEEALNKALEAFSEYNDSVPGYDDNVHYNLIVSCYRYNKMYTFAWKTLGEWRDRGSKKFPSTVIRQLRQEGLLLFEDGHPDKAWDVLQRCVSAERQLPHHYGTIGVTLCAISKVGCATGRFLAVREAILAHRSLRNSESMWQRYRFRFECARYWCSVLENLCQRKHIFGFVRRKQTKDVSPSLAARRARNWLRRTEVLAAELDRLLECDVRLQGVNELRERFEKAIATLQLEE